MKTQERTISAEKLIKNLFLALNQAKIKGDKKHFYKVLDDFAIDGTNTELELLQILYQAGYEHGIQIGSAITLEEWKKVMANLNEV